MKKLYTFMFIVLSNFLANGQCSVTVTGQTNASCNGICDGTVTVTTVGLPNYSYSWSPGGQTIQNPTDLCAGTHTVTMTDANSCVATAQVTITEPEMLQDTVNLNHIAACDSCNGVAEVYAYGGTAPYTHSWSNMENTPTVSDLCPGIYYDTIRDANGCETLDSMSIIQAAPLAISFSITDVSGPTACDGGATANVSGGNGPYEYSWSPGGDSTMTIIGQCAGEYTLCVIDADGCSICDTATINVPAAGLFEIGLSADITISPNPSNGNMHIVLKNQVSKVTKLEILNLLGQVIYTSTFPSNSFDVNIMDYPDGAYYVRIRNDEQVYLSKILKQK